MIQAWVTTPRGSLYYAAEATPYNLSHLRSHIRAMKRYGVGQLRVTVNLGGTEDAEAVPDVSTFLQDLAGRGIRLFVGHGADRYSPASHNGANGRGAAPQPKENRGAASDERGAVRRRV